MTRAFQHLLLHVYYNPRRIESAAEIQAIYEAAW